jgi:Domain of unknown function DUF29
MPNENAEPVGDSRLQYEIVQSDADPQRQWQLIGRDTIGNEYCRIAFRAYGDAWRAAERRKADPDEQRTDLLSWHARRAERLRCEYTTDILTWSERQAALLQRASSGEDVLAQLDWENVIEEVRSAGRRQLTELKSLLVSALASLLQARVWPGSPELPRWRREAFSSQQEAAAILTPAMRQKLDINEFYFKAIRCIPKTINGKDPLLFPTECPVTLHELLAD